jgi:hypothetical protein
MMLIINAGIFSWFLLEEKIPWEGEFTLDNCGPPTKDTSTIILGETCSWVYLSRTLIDVDGGGCHHGQNSCVRRHHTCPGQSLTFGTSV